jgi:glutamate formiminotransferase/formiminotetrahydrofolate cyclodeaminase
MKLVECVPNFSEGRDPRIVEAIADAVRAVDGVSLLDVDPGKTTNRTVYTFAGSPDAVLEAAFQAIKKGFELIDMSKHSGEHARQGACDVCPFVPISGVTLKECVALSERLAERVGKELALPVYLYAEAARRPDRRRLPDIRVGEYEALAEKLKKKEWRPDFGPAKFVPRFGVLTTGARNFLIAYNINLNTSNVRLAKDIALEVREIGKFKRDANRAILRNADGTPQRIPGRFKHVQGTGWLIPEYGRAQVTVNILDIDASPVHAVFDACCELAAERGGRVTGSEVIGMVPKRVLTEAGAYFLKKQGASRGVSESELIRVGAQSLGLSDIAAFDPEKKIIESVVSGKRPLIEKSVAGFVEDLASDSPAPGGGSVAALAGSLAAGLAAMVSALTYGKKGHREKNPQMEDLGIRAHGLKAEQVAAIDDDTFAFNRVMDAFSLPKKTKEQAAARSKAVEAATKEATLVPLKTLERTIPTLEAAADAVADGNPNSLSDAGVASLMARAAATGAYYNVLINLGSLRSKAWAAKTRAQADKALKKAYKLADRIDSATLRKLRKAASGK